MDSQFFSLHTLCFYFWCFYTLVVDIFSNSSITHSVDARIVRCLPWQLMTDNDNGRFFFVAYIAGLRRKTCEVSDVSVYFFLVSVFLGYVSGYVWFTSFFFVKEKKRENIYFCVWATQCHLLLNGGKVNIIFLSEKYFSMCWICGACMRRIDTGTFWWFVYDKYKVVEKNIHWAWCTSRKKERWCI